MTGALLKQMQYEAETWKRLLAFMSDENIYLKNRLAEALQLPQSKEQLEEAEYFQNRFLKEDQFIRLLRDEIVEFDRVIQLEVYEDGHIAKEAGRRLKKLRSIIKNAENKFSQLKQEFNSYMLESAS